MASKKAERSCAACWEVDRPFVKACPVCNNDYCITCLRAMFLDATIDNSNMPPRCHLMLQLHTVRAHLSEAEISLYRKNFAEWMGHGQYCPVTTCSAFIHENMFRIFSIPEQPKSPAQVQLALTKVMNQSPDARHFSGNAGIREMPWYAGIARPPIIAISLDDINFRVNHGHYSSTSELSDDMHGLVFNSSQYNGSGHPITEAAMRLLRIYLEQLSNITDDLSEKKDKPTELPLFACPECRTTICSKCGQVGHIDLPCDTSFQDEEAAMIQRFGYKRCPKCKMAVMKMFGCSQIQCHCGAHWCWRCARQLIHCYETGCATSDDESSDHDETQIDVAYAGSSGHWERAGREVELHQKKAGSGFNTFADEKSGQHCIAPTSTSLLAPSNERIDQALHLLKIELPLESVDREFLSVAFNVARIDSPHDATEEAIQIVEAALSDSERRKRASNVSQVLSYSNSVANLDGGGSDHWANSGLYFGEEPEDPPDQPWGCQHKFNTMKPFKDPYDHGDMQSIECNRCFRAVELHRSMTEGVHAGKRKYTDHSEAAVSTANNHEYSPAIHDRVAWECWKCRLVVCTDCVNKYKTEDRVASAAI